MLYLVGKEILCSSQLLCSFSNNTKYKKSYRIFSAIHLRLKETILMCIFQLSPWALVLYQTHHVIPCWKGNFVLFSAVILSNNIKHKKATDICKILTIS